MMKKRKPGEERKPEVNREAADDSMVLAKVDHDGETCGMCLIRTTYLQMFARPQRTVPAPRDGLGVMHAKMPTLAFYRFLYHEVGNEWRWIDRKKLADAELARIIHDPLVEVHVLYVEGVPAGYAELDRRMAGEIELAYFGIMPEFIGQGLGKYLLHWAIDKAWCYKPTRFWVHTCNLDHPAALPNYQKAGFAIYKEDAKIPPMCVG